MIMIITVIKHCSQHHQHHLHYISSTVTITVRDFTVLQTTPRLQWQARRLCQHFLDLTYLLAIDCNVGSSKYLPRNNGQYPSTAIPFWRQYSTLASCRQKGFSSIWLTAGAWRPAESSSSRWWTPKFDTPIDLFGNKLELAIKPNTFYYGRLV